MFYRNAEGRDAEGDWVAVTGRCVFFLLLCFYSVRFVFASLDSAVVMRSFVHLVNLPFHEAGHILFRPFGRVIMAMGGSLMQLVVPLVCLVAFYFQEGDRFGASVALWWTGQSLMDLAPYIGDARSLTLTLLGGVTGREVADYHDWQFILRHFGLLEYDRVFAWTAHVLGVCIILTALAWRAVVLVVQIRAIRES